MLSTALVVFGVVAVAIVLADRLVRRLPLSPAIIYLTAGWAAGALFGAPAASVIEAYAPSLTVVTELAVLVSLFAVGVRLRAPPSLRVWRVALLLAGPGVLVAIALGTGAAMALLAMPLGAAMVLAAVMAPTDPVLASEVQIRSDEERDAARVSLTVEGALNDGSALPAVMLGLGVMGLHSLGEGGVLASPRWWLDDLVWPIGGGALIGGLIGRLIGHALKARSDRGDPLARDELLYVGAVALAFGVARLTHTSTFVVAFAVGVTLLEPFRNAPSAEGGQALSTRLQAFGARIERLVEATAVLAVGVALHSVHASWPIVAFGLVLVFVVRPLSVLAVVRRGHVSPSQRRVIAWFGIRGVGSLFYLAFVMEHGVSGPIAREMLSAVLTGIALSIVLHGVSATPLMSRYQRRRQAAGHGPPG